MSTYLFILYCIMFRLLFDYRKSTLVFAVNVQHSHDLVASFRSQGIDAFAIDGSTSLVVRAQKSEFHCCPIDFCFDHPHMI